MNRTKFEIKMIRIKIGDKRLLCYLLEDLDTTEIIYMTVGGTILYNDVRSLLPSELKSYHQCIVSSKLKYYIIGLFKKKGIL